jgi:arsenical-resistance protein 2
MATKPPVAGNDEPPPPWYAAYPIQRNAASWVTKQTLLSWMEKGKVAGKDFILVDLRRADFEVSVFRDIHF